MSNFSEIPNGLYNARRRQLIQLIREFRAVHPDHEGARLQIEQLARMPSFTRGGIMGHSGLADYGRLFASDAVSRNDRSLPEVPIEGPAITAPSTTDVLREGPVDEVAPTRPEEPGHAD